jgi:soluble lytic murein transglycosylase
MILRHFVFAAAGIAAVLVAAEVAGQSGYAPGQPGVRAMAPIPDSPVGPRERGKPGPPVLTPADHVLFTRADDAAIHLDWGSARALAAQGSDKTARDIMEWRYALDDHGDANFEQIAAVLTAHPDWPRRDALLARAEKTMPVGMAPRTIVDWFGAHPPVTGYGQVRLGEALVATGKRDEGIALIRKGWIEGSFDLNDEYAILQRDGDWIGADTHAARLDALLWTDDIAGARRQITHVEGEARTVGDARLRLKANLATADTVMGSLPASLRDNPGIVFEQAHALRRAGRNDEAWAVMARAPEHPPHPERWWPERHIMTRDALKAQQYQRAYDIVVHHGLTSGTDFVDGEFLAGWIALRFLHQPALAERHFRNLAQNVGYPISRARANYWLARAKEALGKTGEAVAYYRVAAKESGTFYGQLALARIEDHPVLHVADASGDDAAVRAALAKDSRVYAMRVTADLGQKDLLRAFANQVAKDNPDPAKLRALAALMLELGDRAGSVRIAKQASYSGAMILIYLHPVIPLARYPGAGAAPDPAVVFGLIRQETEFDPDAVSGAGARGLMQLMPSSARAAASRYGLPYDLNALISDPVYNMQLGMGEFATYLDDWNGSYILSIASYNAGESRVREWVATYGDPRSPATDPVDWIELIPFSETRNYVQRVIENSEVYRNRLGGGDKPLMILADLYRPNAPNAPVLHYTGPPVPVEGAATAPSTVPQPRAKPRHRGAHR